MADHTSRGPLANHIKESLKGSNTKVQVAFHKDEQHQQQLPDIQNRIASKELQEESKEPHHIPKVEIMPDSPNYELQAAPIQWTTGRALLVTVSSLRKMN